MKNLLKRSVVSANFLNSDVAFSRDERLRCGISVRQSNNTCDILETSVIVHTNLKEKNENVSTLTIFRWLHQTAEF